MFERRLLNVVATIICLCSSQPIWAQESLHDCPSYPPLINVSGSNIYSDKRGSITDPESEKANDADRAPVYGFIEYAVESIDGPPSGSKLKNLSPGCANLILEDWATKNALRTTNLSDGSFSRYGAINRRQMIKAFTILALKLKENGMELGPHVLPWLEKLVHDLIPSLRQRGSRADGQGNLWFWDGATAAVFYLLSKDRASYQFQDKVWHQAVAAIDNDGYLPTEITRGRRALVYHMYALSAILLLREARRAIGIHTRQEEEARLKLLGARICSTFSNPKPMMVKAQASDMERPGEWGARLIVVYGQDLLTDDWKTCGIKVENFIDVGSCGDQRKLRKLFEKLAKKKEQSFSGT